MFCSPLKVMFYLMKVLTNNSFNRSYKANTTSEVLKINKGLTQGLLSQAVLTGGMMSNIMN